jgi:RES domain-containing protein
MNLTAWRIVRAQHVASAFDGEGSRRYGGRWNHEGIPMIYAAESLSLAALELLVHLDASRIMEDFVCIPVQFDESLCWRMDHNNLPRDWTAYPVSHLTQAICTAWFNSGDSAVLAVPSAIVPVETNYLINSLHPDFEKLQIGGSEEFQYDSRFMK